MTDAAHRAGLVRTLLGLGVVLFALVVAALRLVAGVHLADALLLGVLLALLPALSLAQLPLIEGERIERMPAYQGSLLVLWVLGGSAWLAGVRGARDAASLGLVALPEPELAAWTGVLTAAGLAVMLGFRKLASALGTYDSFVLRELLPRTPVERRVFLLLSVTAGLAEELAYRGFAILALAPLAGTAGAAAISSAAFGVVHAYQGWLGVVRTGLVGGLLAGGFLASGSLWPAILAHTLIDVIAGIVLGERLLSHDGPGGVEGEAHASPEP